MVLEDWLTVREEENIGEGDSQVSELGYRARTISVLFTLKSLTFCGKMVERKLLLLCFLLRKRIGCSAWLEFDTHWAMIYYGVESLSSNSRNKQKTFPLNLFLLGEVLLCILVPSELWNCPYCLLNGKLIQDLPGGHTTPFLISLSSLDKSLVQCPKAYFLLLLITSY